MARAQHLYLHAAVHRRHLTTSAFWKFLDEHDIKKAEEKRKAAGRYRRFPALSDARKRFRDLHPWWPQFDDERAEWQFAPEADYSDTMTLLGRFEQEEETIQ